MDLEIYGIGPSLSVKTFPVIPRNLVTKATISREVKVRRRPMRRGYRTSFDAKNGLVLNSYILAELWGKLPSKMRLKTASTHEKATYWKMKKHEEQIQSIFKNLKTEQQEIRQQEERRPLALLNGYAS